MTIYDKQIIALRNEAREHGDDTMLIIANHALGEYDCDVIHGDDFTVGDRRLYEGMTQREAREECERAIADSLAQDDA